MTIKKAKMDTDGGREELPLSCSDRVVRTYDFLMIMAACLDTKPWVYSDKRNAECATQSRNLTYVDGIWIPTENIIAPFHKVEAICWMAIYNLLTLPCVSQKLQLDTYRLETLSKCERATCPSLLSQIPVKSVLEKRLAESHLGVLPLEKGPNRYFVEVITETLYSRLCAQDGDNYFPNVHLDMSCRGRRMHETREMTVFNEMANRLLDSQDWSVIDTHRIHTCPVCSGNAKKRCSRCMRVWYCSKECQIRHWANHRQKCTAIIAETDQRE